MSRQKVTDRDEGIKSLDKIVRILECFRSSDRAISLLELCRRSGYPRSTTHRLLSAMRETGLLDQEGQRAGYRLGLKLFHFGNQVLVNMELYREGRPFVDSLSKLTGYVSHLAVFDGRQALVLHRGDPRGEATSTVINLEVAPLHCTSVGKAILAYQSDEVLEAVGIAGFESFTPKTITDVGVLKEELGITRERGYAIDESEHQVGVRCIGAPIRDIQGRVVAGISVSGTTWLLPNERTPELASLVVHHAQTISRRLGTAAPLPMA